MQFTSANHRMSSSTGRRAGWKLWAALGLSSLFAIALSLLIFPTDGPYGILFVLLVWMLCSAAIMHGRSLVSAQEQMQQTSDALEVRELEFKAMFESTRDAILVLDEGEVCQDANPAALSLLARSREGLVGTAIHNLFRDFENFKKRWSQPPISGESHERAELRRPDGQEVLVEFTAMANLFPGRNVLLLRDVTERREAEKAKEQSIALARLARKEAEAMRKATFALTQDLRLNSLLDALLETLHDVVPYELGQIFLLETSTRLFLAREFIPKDGSDPIRGSVETLDIAEHPTLGRALAQVEGLFVNDTVEWNDWKAMDPAVLVRSWLGVPLSYANQVVGLLAISHSMPGQFTKEDTRIGASLAISAAVAVQNARLYERAEIYGAELARRLSRPYQA